MIRSLILFACCLIASTAHAGECAKLRPGDSFKELSAILECQDQRIKALEQGRDLAWPSRAGITPSIAADGVWTPGKCFPYEQNQPFKITIAIEGSNDQLVLCWKDGIAIAKVGKMNNNAVEIYDTSGRFIETTYRGFSSFENCPYNNICTLKLANGKVTFVAQMLVVPGENRHARLTIESRPN
jgi:hypothetical protein